MQHRLASTRTIFSLSLVAVMSACFGPSSDDVADDTADTSDTGDGDPGDGDPGDGDPGDGDPGDGDGDPGDGDGDPGDACGLGFVCVPDPGGAWMGPFAIGDLGTTCADAYPNMVTELFAGFAVDPASCDCNCAAPQVSCSNAMSVIGYAQTSCISGQGAHQIGPNECYNTFSASHGLSLGNASATCGAGEVQASFPDPSFDSESVLCGGGQAQGTCAGGASCLPLPNGNFEPGVCYMADGDQACPPGLPIKSVHESGLTDTRTCPETCTCSASGAVCRVSVTGYANANCSSGQGAIVVASGQEECVAVNSMIVQSIRPGDVTVQSPGTCTPQMLAPMGEISVGGTKTVCCSG